MSFSIIPGVDKKFLNSLRCFVRVFVLDQLETVEQSENAVLPGSTSQTLLTLNTASSLWLLLEGVDGVDRVLLRLA